MLVAYEVSIDVIRLVRAPLGAIRARDAELASQCRRAATSCALNVAEANLRTGRDRLQRFRIAAGSVAEVRAALEIAGAWGYLDGQDTRALHAALDRLLALLWGLTHPRRG